MGQPDGLATGPTVSNDKVLGNVFACASQSRRQLDDGSGNSVSVPLGRAPLRQTQTQDRHAAAQLQRVASSSVIPLLRLAQWKRCEVGRWRGSRPTVAQRASRTHELTGLDQLHRCRQCHHKPLPLPSKMEWNVKVPDA